MSTAVATHFQQSSSYDASHHNMANSPTQAAKQRSNNNRAPRSRNNNNSVHNAVANTQSDSGLPSQSQTPRPKKTRPKQNDHRAASNSDVPRSNRPKASTKSPIATPAKPAAYAGPIFHASPAASNLPMPKFASKSVPPAPSSLQAKLDAESPKVSGVSPGLEPAAPAALAREKSPLDIFFNADRQERAQKSASPSIQRRLTPPDAKGIFSMDADKARSPVPIPASAPPAQHNGIPHDRTNADKEAYTQSLKSFLNVQGSNASPVQHRPQPNHAFQTPQQQRTLDADPSLHYGNRNLSPLFHAARNTPPHASPQHGYPQTRQSFDPRSYLESHMPQQQSPFISARPHDAFPSPQSQRQAQNHLPFNSFHSSQSQQQSSPSHSRMPLEESPDVKGMEAKLRGMLKIG